MWVIFYFKYTRGMNIHINSNAIKKKYREMGPMSFEEKTVGGFLLFTIFLWILRNPPGCSETEGCGWEELFHPYYEWYGIKTGALSDTTTVMFTALFLFFVPAKNTKRAGSKILAWEEAQEGIPWEILLLIGSGLALAEAFSYNQFNDYIASNLTGLDDLSPYLIVFLISLSITTLTEFTSNTAVASITLPVIASLAVAIRVNPFFLMMPTVISCSFAFCLPVSTPPNAIVANSGGVRVSEMLKAGIWMNMTAILLNLAWLSVGKGILGINLDEFPSWAEPTA
jgi:sodium-dependent dicarboxylate transporter 2/3/5